MSAEEFRYARGKSRPKQNECEKHEGEKKKGHDAQDAVEDFFVSGKVGFSGDDPGVKEQNETRG